MKLAKKAALLACVLPIWAASGCTGTDVLSTGNTAFTVEVDIVNPITRHESSFFTISAINLRPNGVAGEAALGAAPIGILARQEDLLTVNLNNLSEFVPTTIRLSTGSYRISRIELSGFTFRDLQSPIPAPNCTELRQYPSVAPVPIFAEQLGNPNLTVTAGGTSSVTIVIDGAALVDAFEAAFDCNALSLAGGSVCCPTRCGPPCIPSSQFRPSLFAAAAPTFITFR